MQDKMRAELLRLSKKKQVDRVYGDRREPMAAADRKGVCQRGMDPLSPFSIHTQRNHKLLLILHLKGSEYKQDGLIHSIDVNAEQCG